MKRATGWGAVIVVTAALIAATEGRAGEVTLAAVEGWSGLFGGKETTLHFTATGAKAFKGSAGWRLVVNQRVVTRGESALAFGPGKAATVAAKLRVPPVKDGVVMAAELVVSVYGPGQKEPDATLRKQLWIFSRNPLAGRKKWLEGLKIRLFDPEETTAKVLTEAKIPFAELANMGALADLEDGMLVIGEGVSFDDYRGLSEELVRAAAKGVRVLCLAPAGGEITVPGTHGAGLPAPGRMSLRRADIITDLDKRLDATSWPGNRKVTASALVVRAEDERVVARVAKEGKGWPWAEFRFPSGGRLVICGFGILGNWETGPTPRFLFARLLEYVSQQSGKAESGDRGRR